MNAAERIIEKLGGQTELAKALGKRQSTCSYWAKQGRIPAKWHSILIDYAGRQGVDLSPLDFVESNESLLPKEDAGVPRATHWGQIDLGGAELPCYVLEDGTRVFSLKGVVVGLIGTEGGQLAEYLKVKALKGFLPDDLLPDENGEIPALIRFDTGGEGFIKFAVGVPVERFMDLCSAYSSALQRHLTDSEYTLTKRQLEIAGKASVFLSACAKTGIIALVDEATGYQYDRAQDALQLKYKLYLEEEMRKWEKTFPDQLWIEFGKLTKWDGPVHSRPKYWGKLIMELVYGYLDKDVARWLKENAPKPIHGQNYHQWLSSQFGLKRLVEHVWMLIGMASACHTMRELRQKMAEKFGRREVQLTLYLPPGKN